MDCDPFPSPRPSPMGRGRIVHSLSITRRSEFAQGPSAKHQSDACCSLPALLKQYWYIKRGERVRVRGHAQFYATLGLTVCRFSGTSPYSLTFLNAPCLLRLRLSAPLSISTRYFGLFRVFRRFVPPQIGRRGRGVPPAEVPPRPPSRSMRLPMRRHARSRRAAR